MPEEGRSRISGYYRCGRPDVHVAADSQTLIGFLRTERNVLGALLRRKLRIKGAPGLLVAFGKCFPP
jgi:hypothetical protein